MNTNLKQLTCIYDCLSVILADGSDGFPLVMVGGVLEANRRWDIGKEVTNCISKHFPGVVPIRPKVSIFGHLF